MALIVIDMQNDFITGSLGTKEAEAIVPKVVEKIRDADAIFYTQDTHDDDYLNTQEGRLLPVKHCIEETPGWELEPRVKEALELRKDQIRVEQFKKGTFGSTALAEAIKRRYEENTQEWNEVELVGLCTDICVVSNALLIKAFCPELKITVDASCCAGVTPEKHEAALETMKSCQIVVVGV